ncbi:MAG TPA: choice-of-anchor D domain-containing protein [Candidatus Acidoferrum sp.]|nr:choice-of-anchor D domain-containing protein [Candidatus Acidoferrum sp.]
MALARAFALASRPLWLPAQSNHWKNLRIGALLVVSIFPCSALAQFQQPLVFSSGGAVAVRNDQTGALTAVAGSPFLTSAQAPSSPFVLDVQGRFLFALGTNSIRMFQITDTTTGAYQEVANSPFASPHTNQPSFLAVEPSGNYLAVANRVGLNPGDGSVETFQISPSAPGGPALVPVAGSAIELDSAPIGAAEPPDDKEFVIFMGPNPQSQNSTIVLGSELQTLSVDPQSGMILGYQSNAVGSQRGDSFAMDPQGRYYVTGTQENLLEFGVLQLFGLGSASLSGSVQLPLNNYPSGLWIDSTGAFLYVATSDLNNPVVVNVYSVDLQSGLLTETATSPLPGFSGVPAFFADPTGSFDYGPGADANTAIAYTVDPITGQFVQTSNSPIGIPQIGGALTFSIPPGQQGIIGPSIQTSATNLSFGAIQIGTTSTPQVVTISSNGGQPLSIDSIQIGGIDRTEFSEADTCQAPAVLQPTKFCSVSITFSPNSPGLQQATLSITDNATNSPQSVQLVGNGMTPPPPAPAVSISPNPVNLPSITQGTTGNPVAITVSNSGNAVLNISSVQVAGNNPNDFATTNACNGAVAVKSACNITVTFTPLAAGQRTETITVNDDAAGSPQIINIGGNASPAITAGAAPNGATSAMITAGQTAQFNLQITPGAGYSGTVSLACSGAPLGANCSVPASVQVSNGVAVTFAVQVTTSGGTTANSLPIFLHHFRGVPPSWFAYGVFEIILLLILVGIFFNQRRATLPSATRWSASAACIALLLCTAFGALFAAAGCGGGSVMTVTPPPQIITPQGTSTIIVMPSAAAANGQPLQLQPIPLKLTVN